jgi:hypothetical protein
LAQPKNPSHAKKTGMSNSAEWFWRRAKSEGGPITWDKLQSLASAGKLGPRDFVRRRDWSDWKLACQVSEQDEAQHDAPPSEHDDRMDAAHGDGGTSALPGLPPLPGKPGESSSIGLSPVVNASTGTSLMLTMSTPVPPSLPTMSDEADSHPVRSSPAHRAGGRAAREDAPPPPPLPTYRGAFPFRAEEPRAAAEPEGNNSLAAGALVASLAGLVFLALPMGAVALGLAGWSLMSVNSSGKGGKVLALAGLALGAVDVGAWVVHLVVRVNATAGA